MKIFMMLLILVGCSVLNAGYFDANGVTSNGEISSDEYGNAVRVDENSILTVNGGGASTITVLDSAHLQVNSTSEPLVDFISGIHTIEVNGVEGSSLTFSDGIAHYIYVKKNSTVLLNGGQINYIRSVQAPSVGESIVIDCKPNSWSWIGEEDNYTGITGTWHNGDTFSIEFLNDTITHIFPDTWTHVDVIPEPASIMLLGVGGLFIKRKR